MKIKTNKFEKLTKGVTLLIISAMLLTFSVIIPPAMATGSACSSSGVPSVSTDKEDYGAGEAVIISGTGFTCGSVLTVKITRPDGSADSGTVTADAQGVFAYSYLLDPLSGELEGKYTVEVLDANGNVLATTTFTDTHFRYGHITWTTAGPNTAKFTVWGAFRCGYSPWGASCPPPGATFAETIGATSLFFGDGAATGTLVFTAISTNPDTANPQNSWVLGKVEVTHTYASAGPYIPRIDSCCRLSAPLHANNPDGSYRVETIVDFSPPNDAPTTLVPPIVDCAQNTVCTFTVPASDPNSDSLSFRMSTSSEAGGFVQPSGASINPTTGVYTWNTAGASLGKYYSTQVTIEESRSGSLIGKAAVDFFLRIVPAVGSPPVFDVPPTPPAGSTFTVTAGDTVTFTVQASDPDVGNTVTLGVIGKPLGASFPIPAPANPVSSTFSWTPTGADAGLHVVSFAATDNTGMSASPHAITINVIANTPPVVNAGSDATINEGGTFSSSGSFSDPDANTWTATVNYGDGSGNQPLALNSDKTFSLSHAYADDGLYTVTIAVTDNNGGTGSDSATVTVNNVDPTVNAGPDATINEGDTFSSSGSFSDPGDDTWTATVNYGDSSGDQPLALNPGKTFSLSHTYADNGNYVVTVTVTDDDGGVGSATATVTVNNVAPAVNAGSDQTVNEGDSVSFSGSYTDPAGALDAPYTIAWDFGDGATASGTLTPSHVYADNGVYTVTLTVTDNDGGVGTDSLLVTVNNVAPAVDAGADQTSNEADAVSFSGSYTDPAGALDAPYTIAWDFGDGATASGTLTPSHVYADNGVYTVTLTVTDNDGGVGTDTMQVTVNNVVPTVGPITAPVDPTAVGTAITATASFTDPGTADTHTAVWNWGDGTSSTGTVTETSGSGSVTDSHTYATPGIYTVTLTVTDDDGGVGLSTYQFVVVYDPEGGFVTGGGWINSPDGAYVSEPSLTGKANFGFVSKYLKGANVPTGVTEFQFKAGNLNFHSKNYEWLVVAGARAQYKGTGTINGAGEYGFMLTAIDGQINGGGGVDKFRIKIWDKAADTVVYDNVLGASDDVDAASLLAISGGSIVIHNK